MTLEKELDMRRKSFATIIICLIAAMILAGCGAAAGSSLADKLGNVKEESGQEETKDEEAKTKKKSKKKKPELDTKQAEKNLKEMSDAMVSYLWVALITEAEGDVFDLGEEVDLDLSDSAKIRAAVLASETDGDIDGYFTLRKGKLIEDENAETGPDSDGFHGMSVPDESVEENCLDLFGEEPDWDALPTKPVCDLFDAVSYTDEDGTYALQIYQEVDTETALENHECTVMEEDGKYIGKVNMFWGYWGELEQKPGYSNYVVTYTLEPNDRSKYKMAITAISVRQTEEDPYEVDETGDGSDISLTEEDAYEIAQTLGKGKVCALEYHDYDADGRNEAFVAIGEDDDMGGFILESIWYIGNDEKGKMMRDDFNGLSMYSNESGYYEPFVGGDDGGFFTGECGGYGSGWLSFIFGVMDGEPYELDLSMEIEGFYQEETGDFYTLTDDFTDGHRYLITELKYDSKTGQFKKGKVTDKDWY